jgi:hypothetical protein
VNPSPPIPRGTDAAAGEQISRQALDYLQAVVRNGARLHGASDPSFQTVTVLTNGECPP